MVSPTPLSSNVARKIERSRRVSAKTGDPAPGRRASQIGSAVAARRMASRRAVRPSRAALATVAASRGTFAVRRFESIGRRPRSASARRRERRNRPSLRAVDELRVALRAHGLTASPPAEHIPRSEKIRSRRRGRPPPSGRGAVHGAPLQLPRVVDRRSTSRSDLPSKSEADRAGFVLAQLISDGAIPASKPRRGGGRPDVPTKGGVAARLLGVSPRSSPGAPAPSRVGGGPRDVAPNAPRTRSGSHPVARLRGPVGHASDDASQRIGVLLLVVRDGRVRLRRFVQGGGHHDRRGVRQRERLVVRLARGRRLRARARARARVRRDGVLLLLVLDGRPVRLRRGLEGGKQRELRGVRRRGRHGRMVRLGRWLLARGAGALGEADDDADTEAEFSADACADCDHGQADVRRERLCEPSDREPEHRPPRHAAGLSLGRKRSSGGNG